MRQKTREISRKGEARSESAHLLEVAKQSASKDLGSKAGFTLVECCGIAACG